MRHATWYNTMRYLATVFSTLCACTVALAITNGFDAVPHWSWLPIALLAIPALALPIVMQTWMGSALQSASNSCTPQVISLFVRDRTITRADQLLAVAPVIHILTSLGLLAWNSISGLWVIVGWLPLFGLSIDALRTKLSRSFAYLDPSQVVLMLSGSSKRAAIAGQPDTFLSSFDALSEIALKALDRSSSSLAVDAVEGMAQAMREYLQMAEEQGDGGKEERELVNYSQYYLLRRLEMIYNEAHDLMLEPVCSAIITSLSKIALFAATYDFSMAVSPIHALSQLATDAIKSDDPENGIKACCAIQEVAKLILTEGDTSAPGFKSLLLNIINALDGINKKLFKKDKSTSIPLLMAPFHEIKEALEEGRFADHPDAEAIKSALDDALDQYAALSHVMTHKGGPQQPPTQE